jgi:hypothetical protein
MESVMARLSIEVYVDCPKCDNMIDLMQSEDTSGYNHNEDGHIISQACPDGYWSEEHKKFSVDGVKCSVCDHVFDVDEIEW